MLSFKGFIFHLCAWLVALYSLYVYHVFVGPRKQTYGGNWKFLTFINLNIQFLCFTLCVLCDITNYFKLNDISTKIRKFKEVFYASIGLPSCITVFASFWGIYAIDRELVFPKALDDVFPSYANHLWHTIILITVLEVACDRHEYPRRSLGLTICSLFGLSYVAWIFWINKQSGIWVYPILAELKGPWFVMFLVCEVFFTWLTYLLGECLNNLTGSGSGLEEYVEKHKSKKT